MKNGPPLLIQWRKKRNYMVATAAKSLQSCPTLCHPIDGSPPGSPVPGILKARTLEWVAISFSRAVYALVKQFFLRISFVKNNRRFYVFQNGYFSLPLARSIRYFPLIANVRTSWAPECRTQKCGDCIQRKWAPWSF